MYDSVLWRIQPRTDPTQIGYSNCATSGCAIARVQFHACSKYKIKAEYALRDINKPIGVSDYELGNALPKDIRSSLPSIEDIERDLNE